MITKIVRSISAIARPDARSCCNLGEELELAYVRQWHASVIVLPRTIRILHMGDALRLFSPLAVTIVPRNTIHSESFLS